MVILCHRWSYFFVWSDKNIAAKQRAAGGGRRFCLENKNIAAKQRATAAGGGFVWSNKDIEKLFAHTWCLCSKIIACQFSKSLNF
jgi:hypothetical protein